MTETTVDFEARYAVDGYGGCVFYLLGHVERDTPDTDWDGIREIDHDWVRAVMVGDDREHQVEVSDLTRLEDDAYCGVCGQIGCTHDGRVT
jgi:hypothetical protein